MTTRALMPFAIFVLLSSVACDSDVQPGDGNENAGAAPVSCDDARTGAPCAVPGATCNVLDGQTLCERSCQADGTWLVVCSQVPCPKPSCYREPPPFGTSCNPYCEYECIYEDVEFDEACGVTDVSSICSGAGEWTSEPICPPDPPAGCSCVL